MDHRDPCSLDGIQRRGLCGEGWYHQCHEWRRKMDLGGRNWRPKSSWGAAALQAGSLLSELLGKPTDLLFSRYIVCKTTVP